MPVNQDGRRVVRNFLLSEDQRMAGGLTYLRFIRARLPQQFGQSGGATVHILLVLSGRAHRRDSQQREKFPEETFPVLFYICFHIRLFLQIWE